MQKVTYLIGGGRLSITHGDIVRKVGGYHLDNCCKPESEREKESEAGKEEESEAGRVESGRWELVGEERRGLGGGKRIIYTWGKAVCARLRFAIASFHPKGDVYSLLLCIFSIAVNRYLGWGRLQLKLQHGAETHFSAPARISSLKTIHHPNKIFPTFKNTMPAKCLEATAPSLRR